MNTDYSVFEEYYNSQFSRHLADFFMSYREVDKECSFLGFGVDHLIKVDTFYMQHNIKDLLVPAEDEAVYFMCGIWVMAAADLVVYHFYPEKIKRWHNLTQYIKFTGWNYCATHPRRICEIISGAYHDAVKERLCDFFSTNENKLFSDIIDDVCGFLNLKKSKEYSKIYDFLYSLWFETDHPIEYKLECFRDSKVYFC